MIEKWLMYENGINMESKLDAITTMKYTYEENEEKNDLHTFDDMIS